jgi:lipopolysaccharide/colanic/teichoic acid biosynthesis glycosyltransferase
MSMDATSTTIAGAPASAAPAAPPTAAAAAPGPAPVLVAAVPAPALVARRAPRVNDVACRVLDLAVAVTLLVVLLPLFAVLAVAIRLDSKGPAVFRQRRVGHAQREFTLNKFRTMWADAGHDNHRAFVEKLIAGEHEDDGDGKKPFYKIERDPRVTRVGHFLRKSSLDELPQLWNVVVGEMSLVGPRPPLAYEVAKYPPHWFGRFAVKPGLTGLWQVNGRSELTLEEMIRLDISYAERRSFWLNVTILVRTIPAVLWARGAA